MQTATALAVPAPGASVPELCSRCTEPLDPAGYISRNIASLVLCPDCARIVQDYIDLAISSHPAQAANGISEIKDYPL